ncbi:hypothetical protein [Streptomyces griseoaurantiacus]|uniref:Uncharacterized protein n=1 Tax=Streptomyces griseoaurantiacus TaxID=68213 RepID=A0A7W2HTZ2_9ACTN|nr:hypothetical protein [Streptomyces griseoaurantiacus]MBA5221647.1 hypothetical protein [Streptomyces griseoaurantiacus]
MTAVLLVLLVLLALFAGWLIRRQRRRPPGTSRWRGAIAVPVAAVAALGCTAYSADTSWRFAADYLDMGSTVERAFMFATAELALFATALMARQNLNGPARAPGLPGVLVWVITAVQVIPAYAEFGPVGGTVRALIGPVMAAMLWHLAMGIELRHRTPEAASRSLAAVLVRQARERLLARLGIADQDADAARLIRERALSASVALILRSEAMTDRQRGRRRGRRLAERLHQALEQADVDGDPLQDELLLRKLATRKQALDLASITLPPRWHAPASYTAHGSGHSRPRSARPEPAPRAEDAARPEPARQADDAARPHPSAPGDNEVPPAARPQPARPAPGLPTRAATEDCPPLTGNTSGSASGRRKRKPAARKKRADGTSRASDEVILSFTHRMYEETGSVGRDRVEDALRADGYTVSSDDVGRIVREFKAQLKAAAGAPPR